MVYVERKKKSSPIKLIISNELIRETIDGSIKLYRNVPTLKASSQYRYNRGRRLLKYCSTTECVLQRKTIRLCTTIEND